MYTGFDFKTKKALKEAVAEGKSVRIYQPNEIFNSIQSSPTYTGTATIEGPHYPKPHTWYARVEVVDGTITKVR